MSECETDTGAAGPSAMSTSPTFVDKIDPFLKRPMKKEPKRSQGSPRYRTGQEEELQPLPLIKGMPVVDLVFIYQIFRCVGQF